MSAAHRVRRAVSEPFEHLAQAERIGAVAGDLEAHGGSVEHDVKERRNNEQPNGEQQSILLRVVEHGDGLAEAASLAVRLGRFRRFVGVFVNHG